MLVSSVKVVFASVELTNTGAASSDKLTPPIAVRVSVISTPVRAVLPSVSYTHLTLPTILLV